MSSDLTTIQTKIYLCKMITFFQRLLLLLLPFSTSMIFVSLFLNAFKRRQLNAHFDSSVSLFNKSYFYSFFSPSVFLNVWKDKKRKQKVTECSMRTRLTDKPLSSLIKVSTSQLKQALKMVTQKRCQQHKLFVVYLFLILDICKICHLHINNFIIL